MTEPGTDRDWIGYSLASVVLLGATLVINWQLPTISRQLGALAVTLISVLFGVWLVGTRAIANGNDLWATGWAVLITASFLTAVATSMTYAAADLIAAIRGGTFGS